MDFARKLLKKYGWTDGKGLGKNENGISEALKPKLKRSMAGIGHDAAADFTEHWWNTLYDKAAKNVEVQEKNGKTKKIKTKDDSFKITNSSYHLNKKSGTTENGDYSDFFVRTAVLTSGGSKTEKVRESESEEEGEKERKDVFRMTDEELFAACEGRTAHKGARHGLKALGKLARIECQERMLLTQKQFEGYTHTKKLKELKKTTSESVVEDANLVDEEDCIQNVKKKKKKRKHCFSNENVAVESSQPLLEENVDTAGNESHVANEKKSKKKGKTDETKSQDETVKPTKKKKAKIENEVELMEVESADVEQDEDLLKKDKKRKKKRRKEVMI